MHSACLGPVYQLTVSAATLIILQYSTQADPASNMTDLSSNGNGPSITADEALESVREAWHKTYGAAPYGSSNRYACRKM